MTTSSRRSFLKHTLAGAGAAWSGLQNLASAPGAPAAGGLPILRRDSAHRSSSTVGDPVQFTRGIGIYPGDPQEYLGPILVPGPSTYRNLALLRPAYHSSSYDYNLTAQLVTDGIVETETPPWISTSASFQGTLPKNEREFFLDHNPTSIVTTLGPRGYVQVHLGGGKAAPEIDQVVVLAVIRAPHLDPSEVSFVVGGSDDGRIWKELGKVASPGPVSVAGYPEGFAFPGHLFKPSIPFRAVAQSRFYRIQTLIANAPLFSFGIATEFGEVAFYRNHQRVEVGGPYRFSSAWMSAGLGEEWVYVDLGASCQFDRLKLHWIAPPAEGKLQISDDAQTWRDLEPLPASSSLTGDIHLNAPAQARYVRVLMTRPASADGYILSEFEVYGRGGLVCRPNPELTRAAQLIPAKGAAPYGWPLFAGWRIERASRVHASGHTLSQSGLDDDAWLPATVPGTALTSYLNAGAIPDPTYGENQLYISDSFFYDDFWYRAEIGPASQKLARRQRAWLHFDGINWKAEVFLNGSKLGKIDGGFMRGRFDITDHWSANENTLAVRVIKNDTPGSVKQKTFETTGKNGGALGLDNPTYHASIGWDWIPTIRGRNTGIWGNVHLRFTGPVTLENSWVTTSLPLPDTSAAEVAIEVDAVNHEAKPVKGILRGLLGEVEFTQRIHLAGGESRKIRFDSGTTPSLRLQDPKLWWPNGYGEPNLYGVHLEFEYGRGKISDVMDFKAGLRQMTYSEEGGALNIRVNGRRFVPRGGNWGFSESLLRYRKREYDAALRYHKEMNFTMIRNWVGQIGDDALYEACDRHGVMVWQDFWLANPWDGPDPKDGAMFLANARDTILRIRNHPSIGLFCGRNEGFPPKPLEEGLQKALAELSPGIQYIPSSADQVVSGHGPYRAMPRRFYFEFATHNKLHSEEGAPNIPPIESVRGMMPESALWPQGLDWGLHDFCLEGAQSGSAFISLIENSYGGASNAEDWVALAQFINYNTYRAMFEADAEHRMGLLLWMSHPCWPSFVWQTYDYFFDVPAAYFGCKKACEPLHIQWNPMKERIEVVNYSAGNVQGLTAEAELLNMDGAKQWAKSSSLASREDSIVECFAMRYPAGLSPVHFLRLKLRQAGKIVSENFYLRAVEEGNYRAIRGLPKIKLISAVSRKRQGDRWLLTAALENPSAHPALMVRSKAVREKTGDRILPVIYSDNYVSLMPGESRSIQIELNEADTRGEKPKVVVEGFNVA